MNEEQAQHPWYKETWLWLVLAPLIAAVLYTPVFIYFAITTNDGLVQDNYYKVARGLVVDTAPQDAARALQLKGNILIDSSTGDVQLQLSGRETLPAYLDLKLIHPSHQGYDQTLKLRQLPGSDIYNGTLQKQMIGKRYLLLEPENKSWQLQTTITPPYEHRRFVLNSTPANDS